MAKTEFRTADIKKFAALLSESRRIIVTCHLSPDGDALGSSLGLKNVLARLNPNASVTVVTPDEPTKTLSFLKGYDDIVAFSHYPGKVEKLIGEAALIVCMDFNELARTDLLASGLRKSRAVKIMVDHHLYPENFADLQFSYPGKSATCQLLFELLSEADLLEFVDADAADCILTGMMTDTGDFSYNIGDAGIYAIIGRLIELGADKVRLTRLLFNTFSESNLRIQGYALARKMEVFHEENAALIVLTRDELNDFGYCKGDTEGLVNKPLAIPGVLYSCYLREEKTYIKVSMRSLGDFPVNRLCSEYFGGGGHQNAAGGEFYGTMEECVECFKRILSENKKKYIDTSDILQKILAEENK